MSPRLKKTIAVVATLGACGLGGAAIVQASGDDGERGGATGAQADRAAAAALKFTHGGEVNAVERDGENGATWEVEVTRTDGSTVDVRLDGGYGLVVVEADSED
ncbi:MAG TPA: hypothetical protein VMY78_01950 [Solirubrobacteraceae bacterium]|nr:hypothetical protein [Solirubrobacteraceae bacterium]